MSAHSTIREQAAALTAVAWRGCDVAGEMREWAQWARSREDQAELAALLIDRAEDVYADESGERVTFLAIRLARRLLIAEADAWLAVIARDSAREAAEAAEAALDVLRYFGPA